MHYSLVQCFFPVLDWSSGMVHHDLGSNTVRNAYFREVDSSLVQIENCCFVVIVRYLTTVVDGCYSLYPATTCIG